MKNLIVFLSLFTFFTSAAQTTDCDIRSFCYVFDECINDSTYMIRFEFGADSEGPWNVFLDGSFLFYQERREFGESLLLESGVLHTLTVESELSPDCYTQLTLPSIDCSETNDCEDCEIWDLFAEAGAPNEDCEFYIDLEFQYDNPCSDSFYVIVNGEEYCCLLYGQDFYQIGPFSTEEEELRIRVFDFENEACNSEVFELEAPSCEDENCEDCEIWDLYAEATEPDENCNYFIEFDFEYANVCSDTFITRINGVADCCRLYGEQGYRIGPFNVSDGPVELLIWDFENRDCHSREILVDVPDCSQRLCEDFESMEEMQLIYLDTTSYLLPSGLFLYSDSSSVSIMASDITQVYSVPNFSGLNLFVAGDLSIRLDGPNSQRKMSKISFDYWRGSGWGEISINGSSFVDFTEDNMSNVVITSIPGFTITRNYDWVMDEGGSVTIEGDAIEYLTIRSGEMYFDNFCFESIDCPDCEIFEFFAEAGEANEDCLFDIDFEFEYENRCSDTFYVEIDGELVYGSIDWDETFYTIRAYETEKEEIELTIYDFGNPECSQSFVLETPECDNGEDCKIDDLRVGIGDIVSDSSYYITIDFNHQNTNPAGFDLYWDRQFYGFYDYGDLPLTILVETRGLEWEYLRVSNNDQEDCFDEIEFLSPVWTNLTELDLSELIAFDRTSIKIISNTIRNVEVLDVLGRKRGSIEEMDQTFNFEAHGLVSGVYYCRITDDKNKILTVPFTHFN